MIRLPIVYVLLIIVRYSNAEINHVTSAQLVEQGVQQAFSGASVMEVWKKNCTKSYSMTCLKLDVISLVDRLAEQDDIGILPGVSVIKQKISPMTKSTSDVVANLARSFPNDVDKRTDAYLVHKIGAYLNSHAISIKLFDPKTFEGTKNFNEATLEQLGLSERRDGDANVSARKKDKNNYGGLMAGLMMMKGTMGALGFGALAMLAGKALMTGLMALMLSAIVGLKSLTGGEKKTTYEIVSKPVHTSSHTFSSEEHHGGYGAGGGYARTLDVDAVREAVQTYNGNVRNRRMARAA